MQPVKPIMVTDLFPLERKQLLELFSEFDAEDWEKQTICPGWTALEALYQRDEQKPGESEDNYRR